ncbi:fibronectin type III domain-containing protein [Dactylosporangium sp. NPDC051541]|uniref:fibronectin type III domain-containing protein n=1 Tax=Dactylosporangium sp. NPDC051541 TaxID=3363977 RepID=UPI0037B1BF12
MMKLAGLTVAVMMLAGAGTPSVPGPPVSMTATATYDTADFYWRSGDDGGGAIVRYELSRDDGTTWSTLRTEELSDRQIHARVSGLHVDQEYVFRIRAVNQLGPGEPLLWAFRPVPRSPDAPTGLIVKPVDRGVDVSFRAPLIDGGRAITGYEYSLDNGTDWHPFNLLHDTTGTFCGRIDGLVNGIGYTIMVRALSERYVGPGLDARASATPEPQSAPAAAPVPVPTNAGPGPIPAVTAPPATCGP